MPLESGVTISGHCEAVSAVGGTDWKLQPECIPFPNFEVLLPVELSRCILCIALHDVTTLARLSDHTEENAAVKSQRTIAMYRRRV
jgi:hypothetical protein